MTSPALDASSYDHFVTDTSPRDRKSRETRTRIARAALDLFARQGYSDTTFDQIATVAGVGRRTIFRHFETKEAILFDQLSARRDIALQRLRERPPAEPPLESLHAVLRDMAQQGYDRQLLAQIRDVLAAEPQVAGEQFSAGTRDFEQEVIAILEHRTNDRRAALEIKALTHMALGWFATAAHMYLTEPKGRSLVGCFDEVVAVCGRSMRKDLHEARMSDRRRSATAQRTHA